MKAKTILTRIIYGAVCLLLTAAVSSLLIAANNNRQKNTCSGYEVKILGGRGQHFVDEAMVLSKVRSVCGGRISDRPVTAFDLRAIENLLEKQTWIRDAELWFDSRDVLHIQIRERVPLARVFSTSGESFYLDEAGNKLPLAGNITVRLPVFTQFPGKKKWSAKDSLLITEIRDLAAFIEQDEFWKAQVTQVAINNREFELVPLLGNHLVLLGDAQELEDKFHRLFIFYKEVLTKTGFDHYPEVDLRYRGQVVGRKNTETINKANN